MKQRPEHSCRIATLFIALFLAAQPALAGDDKIKIPTPPLFPKIVLKAPPKIVLPAPPPMVWLPGPQVYVAHNSPHRIFFHDGRYYLFNEGIWYIGPGYAGPWAHAEPRQVPPGLHRFHGEEWDGYQHEADRRYREGRDDDHYAFYARHDAGERHERARWQDDGRRDRGWRDDGRDRGWRGHDEDRGDRGRGRGRGRDDD